MIEEIIAMGTKTRTRILSFGFVHPPKKVRENLGLNGVAKVLRIERIRFIKGQSISYTISYIPSDLGEKINIKDLVVQPLMNVLEDKCKIRIVRGSQVIGATLADSRVASFLKSRQVFHCLKSRGWLLTQGKDRSSIFRSFIDRIGIILTWTSQEEVRITGPMELCRVVITIP